MTPDPKRIVAEGYDALAERFEEWQARVEGDPKPRMLERFMAEVQAGGEVVDLGCGSGAVTALLAERFSVTGYDISKEQVRLASSRVPAATFVRADMAAVERPAASVDGMCALYSLTHLPAAEQAPMLRRMAAWLRPGGALLASLGTGGGDWTGAWLGVPMFFSSIDPDEARGALIAAGLQILVDETVTMREPEGDATFLWLLARNSGVRHGIAVPDLDVGARAEV